MALFAVGFTIFLFNFGYDFDRTWQTPAEKAWTSSRLAASLPGFYPYR